MVTKKTTDTRWESRKATDAAVKRFEEKFAKDMGISLGVTSDDYEVVSTGSLNLDYALGIGGLPTGRIVEMWGPEAAGKTSLACLTAAQYQRRYPDKRVAWVDMEQTFDPKWAVLLGVDVQALWRPPVKTAEDTADATKRFVESGLCSLVVLDSIGGMIAKMEFEKEADESTIGLVAKIVTRMVKQCSPMAKSNNTTVLVINQVRSAIGGYGPDQITAGGWALKHVTTMRMQVRRGGSQPKTIRVSGDLMPVGYEVAVKIQKNKMAPYGKTAVFWLFNQATSRYGPVGVDQVSETYDFARRAGLITGSNWQVLPDGQRFNGGDKVIDHLRVHPETVAELRGKVLATLGEVHDEDDEDSDDPLGMTEALK